MRQTSGFVLSIICAIAASAAFAYIFNYLLGRYAIGYSPLSVLVVAAIFAALAIVPPTIMHYCGSRGISFAAAVLVGCVTGIVLYIINVQLGYAGRGVNATGICLCAAFGGFSNIGAYVGRRLVG